MSPELLLEYADRLGVFVFAISGGVVAVRKEMDLFGVIVLAFLPAIGGGTLRDVLMDQPVFWLHDPLTLVISVLGGLSVFLFYRPLSAFRPLRWADAFGMALFAATGAAKASSLGFGVAVILIMGTITATAGGLLRDVVANEEPLLLKSDIYATAALSGSLAYFVANTSNIDDTMAIGASICIAFAVRAAALIWGWSLPKPRR